MPLIDIEIPEQDGWRDDVASRMLLFCLALVTLMLGLQLWSAVNPEGVIAAIPTFLAYATAIQIMIFAVADVDLREQGRTVAYLVVGLFAFIFLLLMWQSAPDEYPLRLGTDAIAFSSYATEIALNGANPMTQSMLPALELAGAPRSATYHVDGSLVDQWSYPAGIIWWLTPQMATIGRAPVGVRLNSIIAVVALAVLLIRALPAVYAPAALLTVGAPRNQFYMAAGGLIDIFWVLPTAGALVLWYCDRTVLSAAVLGVACAMKQQPMFILPFLAIWLWQERDSVEQFADVALKSIAAGAGTFLLLNLPFILSDPSAWLSSVFTPLGGGEAPLRSVGVGLASFNQAGLDLPRWLFRLCTAVAGLGLLGAYWRWFDRLRWMAWIAPAIFLMFTPRNLPSYVNTIVPLALLALFAVHGRLSMPPARRSEVAG
jgi:uncharacterized membrane protein